jgi:hypothetical protein
LYGRGDLERRRTCFRYLSWSGADHSKVFPPSHERANNEIVPGALSSKL